MKLLAKIRRRVGEEKHQFVRRCLEASGKVMVKKGEKVKAEDVIAEGALTSGFRSLALAEILGVSAKEAGHFLLKKEGEKVRPGEIIAKRERFFGLSKRTVPSPVEGAIGGYDLEKGILHLEFLPQVQRLVAACEGEVAEVPDRKTVVLSCWVSEIFGICGSGRTREGVLKIIAKKDDFLLPSLVDESCLGKIIVGGALVSRAALSKAITVGVSGIIAGGIHARDFLEIGGASVSPFWTSSDIGLTLVLTEGFGRRDMSDEIFSHLEKNNNKFVLISGDQAVLTIPQAFLPKESSLGKEKKGEKDLTEREIEIGDQVRIIDYDFLGLEGKIKGIGTKRKTILGGLETWLVEIETKEGKIEVPYQNIEIII
jgi:hypothetical protein